jgi:hypothetical protein
MLSRMFSNVPVNVGAVLQTSNAICPQYKIRYELYLLLYKHANELLTKWVNEAFKSFKLEQFQHASINKINNYIAIQRKFDSQRSGFTYSLRHEIVDLEGPPRCSRRIVGPGGILGLRAQYLVRVHLTNEVT